MVERHVDGLSRISPFETGGLVLRRRGTEVAVALDACRSRPATVQCLIASLLIALLVSGCAIGNAGAIAGRVSAVEGGWILESYTVGLHVRPSVDDDLGLSLGFAKRTYVF